MAYLFQATVDNSQQIWSKISHHTYVLMLCLHFISANTDFCYLLLGQLSGNKQGVSLNSKNIFIVFMLTMYFQKEMVENVIQ